MKRQEITLLCFHGISQMLRIFVPKISCLAGYKIGFLANYLNYLSREVCFLVTKTVTIVTYEICNIELPLKNLHLFYRKTSLAAS